MIDLGHIVRLMLSRRQLRERTYSSPSQSHLGSQWVSGGSGTDQQADERIRALAIGDAIRPDDEQIIRDRIVTAPFNAQIVPVRLSVRGKRYQGRTVQLRDSSHFVHLVQRVLIQRQWSRGTSAGQYLQDLQRLAHDPDSRIVVYDRGRGPVAGVYGPNRVPTYRQGPGALSFLYVVYAADRSSIITGYQVGSIDEVRLPEELRWLP